MTTDVKDSPTSLSVGAEMLRCFVAKGIAITLSSNGKMLLCQSETPNGITAEIRAEIAAAKPDIIAALTATAAGQQSVSTPPTPQPPSRLPSRPPEPASPTFRSPGWPADLAAWLLTLTPADLPPTPFEFGGSYCVVHNAGLFLNWLKTDAERPGARAVNGTIQSDMRRLHRMLRGAE